MRTHFTSRGAHVIAALFLAAACGDSSTDSGSGGATTIDETAVTNGIAQLSSLIPICANSAAAQESTRAPDLPDQPPAWLTLAKELRLQALVAPPTVQFLTGTQPPDQLGSCGGRMTYPTYSHASGVTTGTYAFENYCTLDSETGERSTANGTISFVNNGTPTATGPVTNFIEADSPGGVTFVRRDAAGTILSSQKFSFTNYRYTAGVPGGSPTSASPNELRVDELISTDQLANKTYREVNYVMRVFETPSGGEQISITGRGYRSGGEFFDVTTASPLVSDADGNTVSGALRIAGANGSNAVMTFVPGPELQATMTVNGALVTSVPPCR